MKIGTKNHIGFEITNENLSTNLWSLNFYLGGKLISNEAVYIPTYLQMFEELSHQLINRRFEKLKFERFSPNQMYNTLIKERDSNETQFFNHLPQIDETIDQYTIFVFQNKSETTFAWNCWDQHNCNSQHRINEVYSVQILTEEVVSTVNQLTEKITRQLANKV